MMQREGMVRNAGQMLRSHRGKVAAAAFISLIVLAPAAQIASLHGSGVTTALAAARTRDDGPCQLTATSYSCSFSIALSHEQVDNIDALLLAADSVDAAGVLADACVATGPAAPVCEAVAIAALVGGPLTEILLETNDHGNGVWVDVSIPVAGIGALSVGVRSR